MLAELAGWPPGGPELSIPRSSAIGWRAKESPEGRPFPPNNGAAGKALNLGKAALFASTVPVWPSVESERHHPAAARLTDLDLPRPPLPRPATAASHCCKIQTSRTDIRVCAATNKSSPPELSCRVSSHRGCSCCCWHPRKSCAPVLSACPPVISSPSADSPPACPPLRDIQICVPYPYIHIHTHTPSHRVASSPSSRQSQLQRPESQPQPSIRI